MTKKIIVIDRDPIRRAELVEALGKQGCDAVPCEAGKEALNLLLFSSVNAVILDYGSSLDQNNPIAEGNQLIKEIINVDAFVPLIVICDRSDLLDHETSASVDLVLRKPITAQQAVDGVKTLLKETLRERAQRKSGYIFAFR